MTENEIKEKLQNFRGWELKNNQIQKTYVFDGFMSAVEVVNKMAVIAEHINHHPDMLIQYNKVTFILSTHSEGGVTDKDFKMAKEIEKIVLIEK